MSDRLPQPAPSPVASPSPVGLGRPVLEVRDLGVTTAQGRRSILRDVALEVGPSEIVGVVGESGSGKSTLCRTISRTLPEGLSVTSGSVRLLGNSLLDVSPSSVHRLRPGGIRVVFQHPHSALNPTMRIGDQVVEALRAGRRMKRKEARLEAADLLEEMGIAHARHRLGDYPFELSGGQRQRIVIAVALAGQPSLLLADEPTSALDVTTQAAILKTFVGIARRRGTAIALITHNYAVVSELCSRTIVLYGGRIMEQGPTERLIRSPGHPYTASLIDSLPSVSERQPRLPTIPGDGQSAHHYQKGCPFRDRCRHSIEECASADMTLHDLGGGHQTACIRTARREIGHDRVAAAAAHR